MTINFPPQNLLLSDDNPVRFKQPFLSLILTGEGAKRFAKSSYPACFIDVNGKVGLYITKDNKPTERLVNLCKAFARAGVRVRGFDHYTGSAGPSFLLRNGALFERNLEIENADLSESSLEYVEPGFRRYNIEKPKE